MNSLDFRQLEAFRAVMERGSVTIAAQLLNVSQPAVSTLVAKLEEAVGYPLFVREHRKLIPTSEAEALLNEVVAVLDHHAQLARTAHDIHETRAGSLTIASSPGPSIFWLPALIAEFLKDRPRVTVKLVSRQSSGIRELIPTRSFDLAIAELPVEHPLAVVKRFQLELVAVLASDSPLVAHPVLNPTLLDGQAFITMFRGHASQLGIARAFDEAHARLRVVAECDYFANAAALAMRGVGVTLIDPISARELKNERLAIRPFAPAITYDFALFHPEGRPRSKLALSFSSAFEETIARHQGKWPPEVTPANWRS